MGRPRYTVLSTLAVLLFAASVALQAAVDPVPLNDHERLGQRLTATMPWSGLWIIVPSWHDAEGGFTLSVWESPDCGTLIARKTVTTIRDNARLHVWLPATRPPGRFYWEIHDRTGETLVGLYADLLDHDTEDCVYVDRVPNRRRAFKSSPVYAMGRTFATEDAMMAALGPESSDHETAAACRELAVHGTERAVPALADLLADARHSHMARVALQAMATPRADRALRDALTRLDGALLIGVINSLGTRRDAAALPALRDLLTAGDEDVSEAATAALGRIGTPAAAQALEAVADTAEVPSTALVEAVLACADGLVAAGQGERAEELLVGLTSRALPARGGAAVLRARLALDRPGTPALLVSAVTSPDATGFDTALWVFQRGVPGEAATRAVVHVLPGLPEDRRLRVMRALGRRGDPAALSVLVEAFQGGDQAARLVALDALAQFEVEHVLLPLVAAAADPDDLVRRRARDIVNGMGQGDVARVVRVLVTSKGKQHRLAGLELASRRAAAAARPAILTLLDSDDIQIRSGALQALRELGQAEDVPRLLGALPAEGADPGEREAAEAALLAVCGRAGTVAADLVCVALKDAPQHRRMLLRALGQTGGERALTTVVAHLRHPEQALRQNAVDVLRRWPDRSVVPHLLAVARDADNERDRVLALRGLVGLAEPREGGGGADGRLLNRIMALCERPEEKRLVLAALARVSSRAALRLATRSVADPALRSEAAVAAVAIAASLPPPGDDDLRSAMETVLAAQPPAAVAEQAQALIERMQQRRGELARKLEGKLPDHAPATPRRPRRLLLYDVNVVYGGHPSRFVANDAFALLGQTTGAFETVLSRDKEVFRPDSLGRFDAVCFNNTVGLPFEDPDLRQSLVEFVYAGGGLMGIHGTTFGFIDWNGTRGDTWPEFGIVLGARGGSHGSPREHVHIKLDDPTHPLNAVFGGRGFEYRDEFFRVSAPYSRDRVRVLFSIDGAKTDLVSHKLPDALKKPDGDYPLAWVRNYGRGRTLYCTIGHNASVFEDPRMLAFYLGAIQFVLGDLPGPTLPSNRLDAGNRAREALGWRLGMTAYSLHKYTFFETMEKTRELGLSYINGLCFQKVSKGIPKTFGPDLTDDELKAVRLKLDETHTRLLTHYVGTIPGDDEGCGRVFEFARKMGIEVLLAEPKPEALDTIERFCDEYDIKVGLHNHGPDQSPHYWHPDRIMEICEGRSKRIGACADIGYWIRAGVDPVAGVRTLGDRLLTIQLHDLHALTPDGHDVPWGTGVGRTHEVLRTIHDLGIRPAMFGLEYSYDWMDNMPEMAECAAFFNRVAIDLSN